jgi:hypothetical protein
VARLQKAAPGPHPSRENISGLRVSGPKRPEPTGTGSPYATSRETKARQHSLKLLGDAGDIGEWQPSPAGREVAHKTVKDGAIGPKDNAPYRSWRFTATTPFAGLVATVRTPPLDVEPQQVVLGEAEAADGCVGFRSAVWTKRSALPLVLGV